MIYCLKGDIFTALESGVDVFESSYPYTASERGLAVTFMNTLRETKKACLTCDSVKRDFSGDMMNNVDDGVLGKTFEINLEEEK